MFTSSEVGEGAAQQGGNGVVSSCLTAWTLWVPEGASRELIWTKFEEKREFGEDIEKSPKERRGPQ